MKMSEEISQIALALSKAQGQIDAASKSSTNPHFKSKYADLNSLREAIREPLGVNDLAILQFPRSHTGHVEVETMLVHKSGEFFSETLSMPVGQTTAQAFGSALTYCRRYALASILNLAAEDDDGNAATMQPPASQITSGPQTTGDRLEGFMESGSKAAAGGSESLTIWWNGLGEQGREVVKSDKSALANLKALAVKNDKVAK